MIILIGFQYIYNKTLGYLSFELSSYVRVIYYYINLSDKPKFNYNYFNLSKNSR
jgi:hypothetical protein